MLIVIEMNVWATVQGIAIATDQQGPSSPMEMKPGVWRVHAEINA